MLGGGGAPGAEIRPTTQVKVQCPSLRCMFVRLLESVSLSILVDFALKAAVWRGGAAASSSRKSPPRGSFVTSEAAWSACRRRELLLEATRQRGDRAGRHTRKAAIAWALRRNAADG